MSGTGGRSGDDEITADDLLIDELAAASRDSGVPVDDGRGGELARLLMTLHCLAECRPGAYSRGGELDRQAADAMVERQANPGGPTCRRHRRSAIAGVVEARSCLDVVIATMVFEDPATQDSALADRMQPQCGPSDHNVSAAIAAAIEALDLAFEDWHDSVPGETLATDVEPPLPAVPAARALGGIPPRP